MISGATVMLLEARSDADDAGEAAALEAAVAEHEQDAHAAAPLSLRYTSELVEDAWIDASRTAGTDHKPLAATENSICFLTRVEIAGVRSPDDTNSCAIGVDEFTGFWEVQATVDEGGQSSVRCNARCLVWE